MKNNGSIFGQIIFTSHGIFPDNEKSIKLVKSKKK